MIVRHEIQGAILVLAMMSGDDFPVTILDMIFMNVAQHAQNNVEMDGCLVTMNVMMEMLDLMMVEA